MNLKQIWRDIRPALISGLVLRLVTLLGSTYRKEIIGDDQFRALPGGKLTASWHGRSMLGALHFRNRGYYALISLSKDGEIQNHIFQSLGFKTIRGSTGRGGIKALAESIRALKGGAVIAFTPDGPRGPSGIVQSGIMKMAQKSGAPICPGAASADRRWLFKSWDRYMVPKPFARTYVIVGPPVYVPADATDDEVEKIRLFLESEIHRLERLAESHFGHPTPDWHDSEANIH